MISTDDIIAYASVFGALLATGFGAPLPEEIPIAGAGILVGRVWDDPGGMHWYIMLPVCITAVVLGDCVLYYIGRRWGGWLIQRQWVQKRVLPPEKRAKIEKNFHDYGIGILLIARLLPGIRTPVFITAGMIKLPFRTFLLADGLYALPGVNLIFWSAFWFTDSVMSILTRLEEYRHLVIISVIAYAAGYLTHVFMQRKESTADPSEIPVVGKTVVMVHTHLTGDPKAVELKPDPEKIANPNPEDNLKDIPPNIP